MIFYWSILCSASPQILHLIRSTLQCSLVQGFSPFQSCENEPPPPRSTPWEHTGDMAATSTFLLQWDNPGKCSVSAFALLHLIQSYNQVEGWWLGMFWWSTHAFMCTNHIDVISHTPAFLPGGGSTLAFPTFLGTVPSRTQTPITEVSWSADHDYVIGHFLGQIANVKKKTLSPLLINLARKEFRICRSLFMVTIIEGGQYSYYLSFCWN